MANEQRLKDAKIKLRLDVSDAMKALPGPQSGASSGRETRSGDHLVPSLPGQRPPSPGRHDAEKDAEDRRRDEQQRPRHRPPAPGGGGGGGGAAGFAFGFGAGRRGARAVVTAVKTLAAATTVSMAADMVPGLIDKRLAQLDEGDWFSRAVLKVMEHTLGVSFSQLGDGLRAVEALLPVLGAYMGTATDLGRGNQMLGLGLSAEQITKISKNRAAAASIEKSFELARRKAGREALAEAGLEGFDEVLDPLRKAFADALSGGAQTVK